MLPDLVLLFFLDIAVACPSSYYSYGKLPCSPVNVQKTFLTWVWSSELPQTSLPPTMWYSMVSRPKHFFSSMCSFLLGYLFNIGSLFDLQLHQDYEIQSIMLMILCNIASLMQLIGNEIAPKCFSFHLYRVKLNCHILQLFSIQDSK